MSVYNYSQLHGAAENFALEGEPDAWDTDPDYVNDTVDPSRVSANDKDLPASSSTASSSAATAPVAATRTAAPEVWHPPSYATASAKGPTPSPRVNFCPECGTKATLAAARFCSNCGHPF
ncbi:hypothetical protein QOT17_010584 [Balamuthia mandrillaris]